MPSRSLACPLLAVILATAGCESAADDAGPAPGAGVTCDSGDPMIRTELFFGLDRFEEPSVTPEEWQEFVDTAVTPRFKDGLTQFDVDGQYLASTGELIREDSRLIMLLHDGGQAAHDSIEAIREEYKTRFDQESVLRIDEPVCIDF
ncbi:ribosomal protein S3 [Sorangium cellulosum]|nr:ribosomal protein S3 [Sorangium cellulosum]